MLSHHKALQKIVSGRYNRACIVEDDLLLPDNFTSILDEVDGIATGFEVILLYWLCFEKQLFLRQTSIQVNSGYYFADSRNRDRLLSTVGYVVSADSAVKLDRIESTDTGNGRQLGIFFIEGSHGTNPLPGALADRADPGFI